MSMTGAEAIAYLKSLGLEELTITIPDPPPPKLKSFSQALVDQVKDLIIQGASNITIKGETASLIDGDFYVLSDNQINAARKAIAERLAELIEPETIE